MTDAFPGKDQRLGEPQQIYELEEKNCRLRMGGNLKKAIFFASEGAGGIGLLMSKNGWPVSLMSGVGVGRISEWLCSLDRVWPKSGGSFKPCGG